MLQKLKDDLAIEAHGMTGGEAQTKGVCVCCKKPPRFYSADGPKEYAISGLCEYCFDEITKEPD